MWHSEEHLAGPEPGSWRCSPAPCRAHAPVDAVLRLTTRIVVELAVAVPRRLLGIHSTIWDQPRSTALLARQLRVLKAETRGCLRIAVWKACQYGSRIVDEELVDQRRGPAVIPLVCCCHSAFSCRGDGLPHVRRQCRANICDKCLPIRFTTRISPWLPGKRSASEADAAAEVDTRASGLPRHARVTLVLREQRKWSQSCEECCGEGGAQARTAYEN